jgi:hypothetical protein
MATIALLVVLAILGVMTVGLVAAGGRDHQVSVQRLDTVRAFYAAEGAMNMAIRELMLGQDFDGDGVAGSISNDADPDTDPAIGVAMLHVEIDVDADTTLTAVGRSGSAERRITSVLSAGG